MVEFFPKLKAWKKSSVVVSTSRLSRKNCIGLVRITRSCRMRVGSLSRLQNLSMTSAQVRVINLGSFAARYVFAITKFING